MRIVPLPDTGEVASLERGEFAPLFAAAEQSACRSSAGCLVARTC